MNPTTSVQSTAAGPTGTLCGGTGCACCGRCSLCGQPTFNGKCQTIYYPAFSPSTNAPLGAGLRLGFEKREGDFYWSEERSA